MFCIQAIITLRNLMKKHSADPRYQHHEVRERVANLYFPYLLLVLSYFFPYIYQYVILFLLKIILLQLVERFDVLVSHGDERDWLVCWVWILRHCDRALLRTWWKKDAQKRHTSFLRILSSCLRVFNVCNQKGSLVLI